MSDIESSAPAPAPAADLNAAVGNATVDWQTRYQQEVADRIKERNLYKPYMEQFKDLSDDERTAVLGLAHLVRTQDYEGVVNWSLATAENVAGRPLADIIAARQGSNGAATTADIGSRPTQNEQPANAPQLSPQELIAAAQEAARYEAQSTFRTQQLIVDYSRQMQDAGYEPATAEGQEIIQLAKAFEGDMGKAINVFRAQQTLQSQQMSAAAGAAANTPSPAPTGAPLSATPASNLTPREKMMNRLQASSTR